MGMTSKFIIMKIPDEGYIKFNIDWEEKVISIDSSQFDEINNCRNQLYGLGLIGAYNNGIGFGNISIRTEENHFLITGSATGNIQTLNQKHYSLVNKYNLTKNQVWCSGLTKASSESLSHAIIYETLANVNAVIHTHNLKMWEQNLNKLPTTHKNVSFGTPEMALEIKKQLKSDKGIIIMGGHEEGILCYGKTLKETQELLISYYNKIKK